VGGTWGGVHRCPQLLPTSCCLLARFARNSGKRGERYLNLRVHPLRAFTCSVINFSVHLSLKKSTAMPQQNSTVETAIMPFKIQQLIEIIMAKKRLSYEDAFDYLYSSGCYKLLMQEDAKLWYMSGLGIYQLLEEEKQAKVVTPPLLLFFAFCLERYKEFSRLPAEEALFTFRKYRVFDYLREGFDVLHTQGESYIVNDIDEFIAARK
jgi:hypothetical protein